MKCVETFPTGESAFEYRRLLAQNGIEARIAVDPTEGLYPALSSFQDVALLVAEHQVEAALSILRRSLKKAS